MSVIRIQIRTKLLLLLGFSLIISLFGGLIYVSISNYSYTDFFNLLRIRAIAVARAELDDASTRAGDRAVNEILAKIPSEKDYLFELNDLEVLRSDLANLKLPESFADAIWENGEARFKNENIFFKGLKYHKDGTDYAVVVSAENYYDTQHDNYLKRIMLIGALLALVFAVVISTYLSKTIFKPLVEITNKVKQISSEKLNLRLVHDGKRDEMGQLTETFNDMLDRIETSFETQNNFISNASHELRTPLTAIIGEADVALSKPRSSEEYVETIQIMLDEAEKLEKKTQALLFLAQTGYTDKSPVFQKVRIDQLLMDVKETISRIIPKSKIQLDLSLLPENPMKMKVHGNEQLLHLALSNIISNGSKYSDNQPVQVSVGSADDIIVIAVKDSGVGIPANELRYIYDPFFRASNTRRYEGYGIGLPLARNIIRMHKGEIQVSSIENQGTTVQIILPVGKFSV